MQIYHKDTGLTEEEVNAWSFLFQGQAQAELFLAYVKFLFFVFVFCKSSSATEIQQLMEQMVEVSDSGTFIVMHLNAKHQEWISQAVNLI